MSDRQYSDEELSELAESIRVRSILWNSDDPFDLFTPEERWLANLFAMHDE